MNSNTIRYAGSTLTPKTGGTLSFMNSYMNWIR